MSCHRDPGSMKVERCTPSATLFLPFACRFCSILLVPKRDGTQIHFGRCMHTQTETETGTERERARERGRER